MGPFHVDPEIIGSRSPDLRRRAATVTIAIHADGAAWSWGDDQLCICCGKTNDAL